MKKLLIVLGIVFFSFSQAQMKISRVVSIDNIESGSHNLIGKNKAGGVLPTINTSQLGQQLRIGVTGDIHKGSIVGIHDYSKGKWGGSLGLFAQYPLRYGDVDYSENYYLMLQTEYSMEGEIAKPNEGKQTISNNYVSAQLYLKYFYTRGNIKQKLFFFGGPRIAFLVSDKREGPPIYAMYAGQDIKVNKTSFALSVGLGLKVDKNVELFMRFNRGLSKVYPNYNAYTTYNRFLGIGFNYFLN